MNKVQKILAASNSPYRFEIVNDWRPPGALAVDENPHTIYFKRFTFKAHDRELSGYLCFFKGVNAKFACWRYINFDDVDLDNDEHVKRFLGLLGISR